MSSNQQLPILPELQEMASGLESANARLTDERAAQDQVKASLEEQIKALSDQVLSLQSEKTTMIRAQEASEEARTTLQTDLDTSRSARAAKDENILALQAQLHDARTEKEKVTRQLHDARAEKEEVQTRLHDAEVEKEKVTRQLHDARVEKEKVQTQLQDARAEKEEVARQLHDARVEKEEVQTQLHDARVEKEKVTRQLHDTRAEKEEVTRHLHDARVENEEVTGHLRDAEVKKEEVSRQLHDARAEKEKVADQLTARATACDEISRKLSEVALEVTRSKEKRDADERRELWLVKRLNDTLADHNYEVRPRQSPVRELEDIEIKLSKMQEAGGRPSPSSLPPIMFYNDPPRTAEVQETDGESLWIMALTGRMHVSGVQDLLDETLRPDLRLKLLPWIEAATWQMIGSIQAIDLEDVRVFHLVLGLILLRCIAYLQSSLSLSPANATLFDLRAMLDELEASAAWQELVSASLFVRIAYDSVRDMLSENPTPEQWTSRVMRATDGMPAGVALTSRNSYLPEGVHLIMDYPQQHHWVLVIHAGTPGEKIFIMQRSSPQDPALIHYELVALCELRTSIRLGHVRGLPAEFHNMELMMSDRPDVGKWIGRHLS